MPDNETSTISLSGDTPLQKIAFSFAVLAPLVGSPDPKWWKAEGKDFVARELMRLSHQVYAMDKQMEVVPKQDNVNGPWLIATVEFTKQDIDNAIESWDIDFFDSVKNVESIDYRAIAEKVHNSLIEGDPFENGSDPFAVLDDVIAATFPDPDADAPNGDAFSYELGVSDADPGL